VELEKQIIAIMKSKETVNNAILYSLNEERRKNNGTVGSHINPSSSHNPTRTTDQPKNHQLSFFAKQLQDDSILQHELYDNSNSEPNANSAKDLQHQRILSASFGETPVLPPSSVLSFRGEVLTAPSSQEGVIMNRISRGDYEWLNDDAIIQSLLSESFQQKKEIEELTSQQSLSTNKNQLRKKSSVLKEREEEETRSFPSETSRLKNRNEQEKARTRQSKQMAAYLQLQNQGQPPHPNSYDAVEVPSLLPLVPPSSLFVASSVQNDVSPNFMMELAK
jgi:hypothetical protein